MGKSSWTYSIFTQDTIQWWASTWNSKPACLILENVCLYSNNIPTLFTPIPCNMDLDWNKNIPHNHGDSEHVVHFSEINFSFATALHLNICLKQIKFPISLHTCAPIY